MVVVCRTGTPPARAGAGLVDAAFRNRLRVRYEKGLYTTQGLPGSDTRAKTGNFRAIPFGVRASTSYRALTATCAALFSPALNRTMYNPAAAGVPSSRAPSHSTVLRPGPRPSTSNVRMSLPFTS